MVLPGEAVVSNITAADQSRADELTRTLKVAPSLSLAISWMNPSETVD